MPRVGHVRHAAKEETNLVSGRPALELLNRRAYLPNLCFDVHDARVDTSQARFDAFQAGFNAIQAGFNAIQARFAAFQARFNVADAAIQRAEVELNATQTHVMFDQFCVHAIEAAGNSALKFVKGTHNRLERRFCIHKQYQALRMLQI